MKEDVLMFIHKQSISIKEYVFKNRTEFLPFKKNKAPFERRLINLSDVNLKVHKELQFISWRSQLIVRLAVLIAFLYLSACSTLQHLGPTVSEDGVVFRLKYPEARQVAIVGSFNHWDKEKDALSGPDADGVWSITLPMKDGRYEYLFLINGEKWLLDPAVPSVDDGLGGRNSVIHIRK